MIGNTSKLQIVISAVDKASKQIKQTSKELTKAGESAKKASKSFSMSEKRLKALKIGAGLAGAAIAGMAVKMGISAVKQATKFQKEMTNVATLVDTSKESMEEMGKKVRDISKRMPVDIGDLTAALYQVRSAGIDAKKAMGVLETSAKLATAGLATTEEATDLLTSAINVFGDEAHSADKLADILFKTVKYGKTTVAELAQGFGKVANIAKETGISIEDLSAATAVLTTGGLKAAEAQTAIKAAISNILKPTADARAAAEKLGIQFDLNTLQSKGLSGMLLEIAEAAGDDKQSLTDLFGSVEATNAIFSLTSTDGGAAMNKMIEDMIGNTNELDIAFQKQNATMEKQYQLLQNNLNVVMMELGTKILPIVMKAVQGLNLLLGGLQANLEIVQAQTKAMAQEVMAKAKEAREAGDEERAERLMKAAREAYAQEYGEQKVTGWDIIKGGFKSAGELLSFQEGGVVPGQPNEPQVAVVHGGEKIIPAGEGEAVPNQPTYNFHFEGAFIGNELDFTNKIIRLINRDSELKALAGV